MTTRRVCGLLLLVFEAGLLAGVAVHAQTTFATVTGQVTDAQGRVVPGTTIVFTNVHTNIPTSTQTNEEGIYRLVNLHPGIYRANVARDGFKSIVKGDIELHVQSQVSINFELQVGSVAETITVLAGAPLINTESGAVGTVVDRQFVENIPLNGRSFQTLIALTPGTVITKTDFNNQGQFSVNGQRANANYFTVDGVSANIGTSTGITPSQVSGGGLPGLSAAGGFNNLVSVDAMQEFRVQTSTYSPEFGRTPGGQISIVTRSGTNEFHGALFEYFRNDALDANDWFANRAGLPKPALRQSDFGGVLGGPIIRNRTFFFFSYEGLRLRLPQTQTGVLVPSVAVRQAAPPEIQRLLNAYPIPNGTAFPDGTAEFSASYSDSSSLDATSIRIDHAASSKLRLFGRFSRAPSDTKQRIGSLSSSVVTGSKTQTLTGGATWDLTAKVSNDFRANYSRNEVESSYDLDDLGGAVPPPDSAVFPISRSGQDSLFSLSFFFGGPTTLQLGKAAENVQRQLNFVDGLSVSSGEHQLKFGVDYRWLSPIANRGSGYSLTPAFTDLSAPSGGALSGTTFLTFVDGFEEVPVVFHNFSIYAQDTWRVKPRLTLTYGLRWEVNPAPSGKGKPLFTLDNLDDLTMLSVAPEGTPLYKTTYTNFAPRVGLACRVSQKQSWETILRGGFGLFYDLGSGALADAVTFPYFRTKFLFFAPYPLSPQDAEPPPISLDPPFFTSVADRNLKLPYTYHWSVSLEQSLGASQTVSVSYVGAVGRRLLRRENLSGGLAQFLLVTTNKATSDYHALQLQFQRRLSRGLQALASYTWSHSIDISSSDTAQNNIPANLTDVNIDRGSSDFDVRHSFNAALTYDLPTPNAGSAGKALLGNWSVDGIFFARTATPVDLIGGTAFTGGFVAPVRPDAVPGAPLEIEDPTAPGGTRFNSAAFVSPPTDMFGSALRQGTLGRNVLRGFGAWQFDLALRRQFNLSERVKLQFRAEFFNLFNHPNFGDPGAQFDGANRIGNPIFGQSTQMLGRSLGSGGLQGGFNPLYQVGEPRSIQFAARLEF